MLHPEWALFFAIALVLATKGILWGTANHFMRACVGGKCIPTDLNWEGKKQTINIALSRYLLIMTVILLAYIKNSPFSFLFFILPLRSQFNLIPVYPLTFNQDFCRLWEFLTMFPVVFCTCCKNVGCGNHCCKPLGPHIILGNPLLRYINCCEFMHETAWFHACNTSRIIRIVQ